ncbi:MAG: PAS domain S-box protein [Chitinophagales bacterium]|nr:PAS domain S-box protein [Chitinophagales bacterium]
MEHFNLLLKFKSEIFWKERIIALLVTISYLLGNIIELFTKKEAEDPIIIWVIGVLLGVLVVVISMSRFRKFTPFFFNLFIYYANFNLVYAFSKSIETSIESQSFYLLANYVLIVVSSQVLESLGQVALFSLFEVVIFGAVIYLYREANPLLLNYMQLLVFSFVLAGNYLLSMQRIRLTQINSKSGIQFKNLTENARDISALFDRALNYVYVNKSVYNATGYSVDELVGENLLGYIIESDRPIVQNAINELALNQDDRKSVEYKIQTKSGAQIWVESIFGNFKNGEGLMSTNLIFAETRNIERRKKLEDELQKQLEVEALFLKYSNSLINLQRKQISSEIYKLLSEATPKLEIDTIAVYSLTKDLFRLETAWFNTITDVPINVLNTGVTAQEIVTKIVKKQQSKDQIVHYPSQSNDGKNIFPLFFKQAISDNATTITIVPLVSGNSLIGIAIAINNINTDTGFDSQDTLLKILGVMISNALSRKTTEDKLAEVQNTNEAILKALPDWLYTVNGEGKFTSANLVNNLNPYLANANIEGQKFHDVLPDSIATKYMDALFAVIETDTIFSFEYKDGNKQNEGNWFKVIFAPFRYNEYLVIIRDISELKNAQEELENKAQKLQKSNKELEEFAYVVSHDMKQPIRTVISYLNLLEKRYKDKFDADGIDFIQTAIHGANKMNLLVLDILNYSRMDQEIDFNPSLKLGLCFEKVTATLKELIESSGAIVRIDKMPMVSGNETMLSELIQNLIENGIKYNRSEQKEIWAHSIDKGTYWLICIKDNGIGFEQKYADQIFKIFKRLHNDGEFSGSGVGLAICAKAVEKHGGKIWAESEPGKGSVFYFTMPK